MKKETLPFMVYGYFVTVANKFGEYINSKKFDRLTNAQEWGNRFRGVGSVVKIYADSRKVMEKHDTQKF